jgi:hypothetical protein
VVNDENQNLCADSCHILNRLKNYFSQLFNAYGVKDVTQTEIRASES